MLLIRLPYVVHTMDHATICGAFMIGVYNKDVI